MTSVGETTFPLRLRAQGADVGIDLTVRPEKPMVLQGNQGLSQKGPGVGNASYYYSYTRLATEGTLVAGGDTLSVTGQSWLDREWSTSALGPNQVGWDWFSLQLDDGRDLMYYQLRNKDGSASRFSEGTLVAPDGATQKINRADVSLEVLDTWTTPDGTHTYPVEWTLRIPSKDLSLRIVPLFPQQELEVSVRYWEGAVRVRDGDGNLLGTGYVELTGYGDSPASPTS
jgi:predicted secreted hydrolase